MSLDAVPVSAKRISPQRENWQRALHRFRSSSLSTAGVVVVLLLLFMAIFGAHVAPYPEQITGTTDTASRFLPPSWQHWFGTNDLGQDVFSLVLGGARVTLSGAFAVVLIGAIVGTILGAIAGYFGGWIDEILMRFTDLMLILPSLILAMVIGVALGTGLTNLVIAIAISWWPGYARMVRGEVLSKREELFVVATRALGAKDRRIIFNHILPNVSQVLIVRMSIDIGSAILIIASLSFIGIGIRPPTPEWGLQLSQSRLNMPDMWWTGLFPGLAIFLAVFAFNIVGEALRTAFDPRNTR
jgi:peptide/nickel transport system permease protein